MRIQTALATLFFASGLGAAAQAQQDATAAPPATFLVVHGIPGRDVAAGLNPLLPVDVKINGSICLLQGITFGSVSGPFTVPAGTYQVEVSLADTITPCSNAAVIKGSIALTSGKETAVVAALSPKGAPTAYAFPLDLSKVGKGQGRIFVAHAADAPAVDVSGVQIPPPGQPSAKFKITDLTPGKTQSADFLIPGTYRVTVSPSGSATPVVGPVNLAVPNSGAELVFAVGKAASGSITVLAATIPDVF